MAKKVDAGRTYGQLHTDFELLALTSDFKKEEASGFLGLIRLGVAH